MRWRRWGWTRRFAAGGLALLALAGLVGVLFYALAVVPDRRSVPYRRATERLRQNASAVRLLGKPIETGWGVRGRADADSARFAVPVSGSMRAGVLYIEARKTGHSWSFTRLELAVDDASLRLSLLEKSRRQQKQNENGAPLEVPPRYQK